MIERVIGMRNRRSIQFLCLSVYEAIFFLGYGVYGLVSAFQTKVYVYGLRTGSVISFALLIIYTLTRLKKERDNRKIVIMFFVLTLMISIMVFLH